MPVTSKTRYFATSSWQRLSTVVVVFMLANILTFAQQPNANGCSGFKAFPVLNARMIRSHVLSKADLSSPLLATVSAHTDITIRIFVSEKGSVVCAKSTENGNPFLSSLAEQAAMKWKFSPYVLSGVKTPFQGDIVFHVDR